MNTTNKKQQYCYDRKRVVLLRPRRPKRKQNPARKYTKGSLAADKWICFTFFQKSRLAQSFAKIVATLAANTRASTKIVCTDASCLCFTGKLKAYF